MVLVKARVIPVDASLPLNDTTQVGGDCEGRTEGHPSVEAAVGVPSTPRQGEEYYLQERVLLTTTSESSIVLGCLCPDQAARP